MRVLPKARQQDDGQEGDQMRQTEAAERDEHWFGSNGMLALRRQPSQRENIDKLLGRVRPGRLPPGDMGWR